MPAPHIEAARTTIYQGPNDAVTTGTTYSRKTISLLNQNQEVFAP
jgi:hypothetical protein